VAIQDTETTLSALRINPGVTGRGLSQQGIDYQLGYVDTLKRSCTARRKNFDQLLAQDLPALNDSLKPQRPTATFASAG
jgi:hypothetical protein